MAMVGVVRGDDCTAGCVGCENPNAVGGGGGLYYVGNGCGEYRAESTYRYVGYGGDFTSVRRRRDFTCLITTVLLAMLMLLLLWLTYPCQFVWSYFQWCPVVYQPPPIFSSPSKVAGPVDPYNCASDLASYKASWSKEKKEWCCNVHGKACDANQSNGWYLAVGAISYDCNVGFENWVKGWSPKKADWCCSHGTSSCGYADKHAHAGAGFGAQAQHVGILNPAAGGGAQVAVVRSVFNPKFAR